MTSPPTTFAQRAAEYLGYQMAARPRLRRFATFWLLTHMLGMCSVVAAPPAAASTLAGALNWTGITDSQGVPIGDFYLSVVSSSEAITKAGPHISADPTSWARWLANAVTTGLTHDLTIELLQAQAAIYIFMITIALWLMRFAMSNLWLHWLVTWFRPLFETIRAFLADHMVFPICLVAGLGVGAYHILWHGRKGFGSAIMVSTFAIGILGTVLTNDTLTDLYSENDLISRARNAAFETAQAFANNGPITNGGSQAQLHHLTGLIVDATLRMPLQVMNFGAPVDNIGTCAHAYTAALLAPHDGGDLGGAAHAMASCGAPQALTFAQHLNGANLAPGVFFILLGAIFAAFVCYVTYSYVMVCCAAFINALLAMINAAPAMIHGRPRRRAGRRLKMFFKHAALVFAYTAYISVAALIVLKMAARGGYADQVGMTHPLARLFMIALLSVVAIGAFWWLKHELGDHTRHELTHFVTELADRGREGYRRGQDAYDRARELNRRAPWSKTDDPDSADSTDDPDQPLTGKPVNGRPPGGRPPSPGRARRPAPGPRPPASPGAAGALADAAATTSPAAASAASGAAAAGQAATTVLAPEVIAGAAVATQITHRLHRDHSSTRNGTPRAAGPRSASTPSTMAPGETAPASPAPGRTTTSSARPHSRQQSSPPQQQRHSPATSDRRPIPPDPTGDGPVNGRQ
jgi:hypothetical protein